MTNQKMFDKVVNHLLTQNAQSTLQNSECCAYRGHDGLKCAIGCLITNEDYRPDMEGDLEHLILNYSDDSKSISILNLYNEELLFNLQTIHDTIPVKRWADELKNLAKEYELDYNGKLNAD